MADNKRVKLWRARLVKAWHRFLDEATFVLTYEDYQELHLESYVIEARRKLAEAEHESD